MFGDRKMTEIVWRRNGDATRPAGYVLERVEVDFSDAEDKKKRSAET